MPDIFSEDTIAAIATPIGEGALSVIRLSGKSSIDALEGFYKGKKPLSECATHTIHYGTFSNGSGDLIDDVLVSVFRAPRSYTGEDSVEISTHGNPIISQNILTCLLKSGVRLAEPGEFTRRAFLNGRIDLAQAEAVCDLISSRTDTSLKGARNQLNGLLSRKVNELRDILVDIFSLLELELDFAEEDLEFADRSDIIARLDRLTGEVERLIDSFSFGRVFRDGVNVAIIGKPNVGKSSLLNYLLKESRAIVSSTPGTTRDIIREEIVIDGILYTLFDTAGIRQSADAVEAEGIFRSWESVKNADLVLFMNDIQTGIDEDMRKELRAHLESRRMITVLNKIDIDPGTAIDADIKISALTGSGVEGLFSVFRERVFESKIYSEKSAVITNVRHLDSLTKAREALRRSREGISGNMSGEFIAADLRMAEGSLSEIIGKTTTDDVLNNIFSKFCIGK